MHRIRTLPLAGGLPGPRGPWTSPLALLVALCLLLGGTDSGAAPPQPAGEMRWALYVTFPPAWLDPAEVAIAGVSPFWLLYAVHDALVKPMPGNPMAPSLAESWTVSADFRVYDFHLRQGLTFHNGDPFTAEDVKFSFLRYKWPKSQQEKVQEVEIVDPYRVRIHLREPWPDFMTGRVPARCG
jgi:peptide/nickel transport system substrate-binding protein